MIKRADWMMPTPFVLNDAVVITQKIRRTPKFVAPVVNPAIAKPAVKDSLSVAKGGLQVKQKGL